MPIVAMVNFNPWDLCIVNTDVILSGMCFLLPRLMGGIDTFVVLS
jgi:hypothetical protein